MMIVGSEWWRLANSFAEDSEQPARLLNGNRRRRWRATQIKMFWKRLLHNIIIYRATLAVWFYFSDFISLSPSVWKGKFMTKNCADDACRLLHEATRLQTINNLRFLHLVTKKQECEATKCASGSVRAENDEWYFTEVALKLRRFSFETLLGWNN